MEIPALPEHIASRREAMRTNRFVQAGCALLAVVLLAGASMHQPRINAKRAELQLVLADDVHQGMPPDLAFLTTALGSFRGLAFDFLWIRGEKLKSEGKYYEAFQISQWLCKLQPRFASVWVYHAWNMAYNISVGTYSPDQRWKWVYNGIRLLRDQGRVYNPKSVAIYRELSWILFHKIGDIMDDYHPIYKRAWAGMFERVLGRPTTDPDRPGAIEWFRPIAQAPTNLDALRASGKEAAAFLDHLDELGIALFNPKIETLPLAKDGSLLAGMCKYGPNGLLAGLVDIQATEAGEKKRDEKDLIDCVTNPRWAEGRDAVVAYARAKVLREVFGMDPGFMLSMMEEYGPFDWRSVYAHSLYWARQGVEKTDDVVKVDSTNTINNYRMVFLSLGQLFRQGSVVFEQNLEDPFRSYFQSQPNPGLVDALHKVYLTLGKYGANEVDEQRDPDAKKASIDKPDSLYQVGHQNFLNDAIVLLYLSGREEDYQKAEHYLTYLRNNYRADDGHPYWKYTLPMDEFVFGLFKEQLEINKYTQGIIYQLIHGAYYELMLGRSEGFKRRTKMAENCWVVYRNHIPDADRMARQKLPSIPEVQQAVVQGMMAREPIDPLLKARLWSRLMEADPQLLRGVYDSSIESLRAQCKLRGLDVTRAFSEPPGMKAYRATRKKKKDEPKVKIGEGSKR